MPARLLPGVQRVSDGVWKWGRWEINRVQTPGGYWMAVDTDALAALGPEPPYSEGVACLLQGGTGMSDLRHFLWELNERGA